jgi:hypothetical protein
LNRETGQPVSLSFCLFSLFKPARPGRCNRIVALFCNRRPHEPERNNVRENRKIIVEAKLA